MIIIARRLGKFRLKDEERNARSHRMQWKCDERRGKLYRERRKCQVSYRSNSKVSYVSWITKVNREDMKAQLPVPDTAQSRTFDEHFYLFFYLSFFFFFPLFFFFFFESWNRGAPWNRLLHKFALALGYISFLRRGKARFIQSVRFSFSKFDTCAPKLQNLPALCFSQIRATLKREATNLTCISRKNITLGNFCFLEKLDFERNRLLWNCALFVSIFRSRVKFLALFSRNNSPHFLIARRNIRLFEWRKIRESIWEWIGCKKIIGEFIPRGLQMVKVQKRQARQRWKTVLREKKKGGREQFRRNSSVPFD